MFVFIIIISIDYLISCLVRHIGEYIFTVQPSLGYFHFLFLLDGFKQYLVNHFHVIVKIILSDFHYFDTAESSLFN